MGFYIALYALILLIGLYARERELGAEVDASRLCLLACCLMLFVVAAIRSSAVGADTDDYEYIYTTIGNLDFNDLFTSKANRLGGVEPGYRLYNWLLYQLSPNPQSITAFNSMLLMVFVYRMIRKNSKDYWLSIALFYALGLFQSAMNLMPSAIAGSFVFSFFYYIKQRKLFRFLVVVVAAAVFFHTSALFLLLFYFVDIVQLDKKKFFVFLIIGAALSLGATTIIPRVFGSIIPSKYLGYLESTTSTPYQLLVGAELVGLTVICRLLNRDRAFFQKNTNLDGWVLLLTIVVFLFAYRNHMYARLALILTMYFTICIPNWLSCIEKKPHGIRVHRSLFITQYDMACFAIVFISSIAYVGRLMINNIGSTVPYTVFFA